MLILRYRENPSLVLPWLNRGNIVFMTVPATAFPTSRASIVRHIASNALLHLYRDGHPDYKRIADLAKLSKADLSKISQVAKSSVRFDAHIPEPVAARLR